MMKHISKTEVSIVAGLGMVAIIFAIIIFFIQDKSSEKEREPAMHHPYIYQMCMNASGIYSKERYCQCFETKVAQAFPDTITMDYQQELWEEFLGDGKADMRKDLFIKAEIACQDTFIDYTCFLYDEDTKERVRGQKRKAKKQCECRIKKMQNRIPVIQNELMNVKTHDQLNKMSYGLADSTNIYVYNWRQTDEARKIVQKHATEINDECLQKR